MSLRLPCKTCHQSELKRDSVALMCFVAHLCRPKSMTMDWIEKNVK